MDGFVGDGVESHGDGLSGALDLSEIPFISPVQDLERMSFGCVELYSDFVVDEFE